MNERRELIARPTALGVAFANLYATMGHDTRHVRLPLKREPTWSVKRVKKG